MSAQQATQQSTRYHNLDAMRGLLALAVAVYHFGQSMPGSDGWFAPSGPGAVDMFFLLSGFVIAHAYDNRMIHGGMTASRFGLVRFIRLYPVILVGVLLGCIKPLMMMFVHDPRALSLPELGGQLALNGLVLPTPQSSTLFPLNPPAWSLFFEAAINLVYALVLLKARKAVLCALIAVSGIVVAYGAYTNGSADLGWGWSNFIYGAARVGFSFPLGVLLFRLGVGRTRRMAPMLAVVHLVITVGLLMLPVPRELRGVYHPIVILLAFPALLSWGASLDVPARFRPVCELLGDMSFPLYAIHYPILMLFLPAIRYNTSYLMGFTFVTIAAVASVAMLKFYDEPVRTWLTRHLNARKRTDPNPTTSDPAAASSSGS
jgi:peptidoglycan/LPS O-acetylase OafA/YrhL